MLGLKMVYVTDVIFELYFLKCINFNFLCASSMLLYLIYVVLVWSGGTGVWCETQEIDVMQEDRLRWPGGVVHYSISENFTLKQFEWIRRAMNMIEEQTCIIFEERPHTHRHKPPKTLYIKTGYGCTCKVGYRPYGSVLKLHKRCFKKIGHVVHELLHALGIRHEHQRFDRNYYIHINQSAIRSPYIKNFYRRRRRLSYICNAGLPYDYESIMHYPKVGFSISKSEPIISPIVPCGVVGQRVRMSRTDVGRVNRLYACTGWYLGDDIPGSVPYKEWQRHVQRLRRLETRRKW